MLGSTQVGQLLKLPVLIAHYQEHKKHNPSINFWGYLHVHYAHAFEMDEDFKDDLNLPFKSTDAGSSALNMFTPASYTIIPYYKLPSPFKTFFHKNDSIPVSQYLSAIWQPPRCC